MDHCPLCLNTQAFLDGLSNEFGKEPVAVATIRSVYRVDCPDCATYDIDESALFLLQHCDEVRQRAVTDLRQRGLIGHAIREACRQTLTVELLQSYVREEDIFRA